MATALIEPTLAADTSDDFSVDDSAVVMLNLTAPNQAVPGVTIQIKTTDGYTTIGRLDLSAPALVISASGDYRVVKKASVAAFGVDVEGAA